MATPWQLQQDLMHVNEAGTARASRHAAQLRELRLSAGGRNLGDRVRAVLGAMFQARAVRKSGSFGVVTVVAENRLES